MNSKRLYFALIAAIAVLAIGLIGGAYGVDLLLTNRSQDLVRNKLQVAVLAQEQQELAKAKRDVQKYQDLANIAKSVVPEDKDEAETVQQIVGIANANGVSLSSIAFPSSTLGSKGTGLSQLAPVKGVTGVFSLQLTVQSDSNKPVAYSKFIAFLSALEHNRRTAQVSSITIQPNTNDRSTLAFTLVLNEYIKP